MDTLFALCLELFLVVCAFGTKTAFVVAFERGWSTPACAGTLIAVMEVSTRLGKANRCSTRAGLSIGGRVVCIVARCYPGGVG